MSDSTQGLVEERERIQGELKELGKAAYFGGPGGMYERDEHMYELAQRDLKQQNELRKRLAAINAELGEHGPEKK